MHQNVVSKKVCSKILFSNNDITFGYIDSDIVRFLGDDGLNSYLFVSGIEVYKFKAKDSEVNAVPLLLGNVSKGFLTNNLKKTGLYRYVHDFSVDYYSTDVGDIKYLGYSGLDINKYLMAKNNIK